VTTPKAQGALKQQVREYLSDTKSIVDECLKTCSSSAQFSESFRISLATKSVLSGLTTSNLRPSLSLVQTIVLRIPMLSAIGQGSIAHAEFRRFLELLFWTIYFTDHSAEWAEFQKAKNGGFSRDQHKPISFAANRELGYYVDYTAELMENDPSGLGSQSVAALRTVIHELNSNVHAGQIAKEQRKLVPYENPDSVYLSKFVRLQRSVFSSSCIVLAAYKRQKFERLPAAARANFDWLVGPVFRRKIRSGPFGNP